MTWRLLRDAAHDGAANMARDRALLDALQARLERGEPARPVLRLYSWTRPTVSYGRHQEPEDACDLPACLAAGIDAVRRPTGGRAVLHDDEITYAVVAPATGPFEGSGVERGAALIARALARGLAALGAPVEAVRGVAPSSPRAVREACFLSASRSELVFEGRKLVGSAQFKSRLALLQHGSLPLTFDAERQARFLGSSAALLRRFAAGLDEALGARPDAGAVGEALAEGLAAELGVTLEASQPDDDELAREAQLAQAIRSDSHRWRAAGAVSA